MKEHLERWSIRDARTGKESDYTVRVRNGKPFDILSLKIKDTDCYKREISHISSTRRSIFGSGKLEELERCPVCGASSSASEFKVNIYGARYHQCSACSHAFVIERPSKKALEKFYAKDIHYSLDYTDKALIDKRIKEIVIPKAKWMIENFKDTYKRFPRKVLDVGAGGGHFVYACRKMGLEAEGIEISKPEREFCKKNFAIDLHDMDFTRSCKHFRDVDIITFWGVIEHVPDPVNLLRAAHRLLGNRKGLMVVEVPRWESLSTIAQNMFSDSITRHLDPLGHINFFTDRSLTVAFKKSGFIPRSVWYFGMDVYEVMMQLSFLLMDSSIINRTGPHIDRLQKTIDKCRLSDTMVLAGIPDKRA